MAVQEKNGNTAIIMKIVLEEMEHAGIETELIQFGNDTISHCRGCFSCKGKGQCIYQKDRFCEYFTKLVLADGI